MQLLTYLGTLDPSEVESLAYLCETTPLYLYRLGRDMRRGRFSMQPRLAALLESHTNKSVQRWECIPDEWWLIWPELVGRPGLPPIGVTGITQTASESQPPLHAQGRGLLSSANAN
jgi:hypothetical protein